MYTLCILTNAYSNSSIKASEYQNALTVDATTQINITLQYSNLGEDAFDPLLTFTLPTELSSPRIYSEAAVSWRLTAGVI